MEEPNLLGETIYVPGKPIPLRRPRFSGDRAYDSQKKQKEAFAAAAYVDYLKEAFDCPIAVYLFFGMPIPSKMSKRKKSTLAHSPHTGTPDIDNLIKFVFDAGNKILWADDCLIHSVRADKYYALEPHTRILIVPSDKTRFID